MTPIPGLGELIDCPPLLTYIDPRRWFTERDTIKALIAARLRQATTAHWLSILEPADIWCADVLTWPQLLAHDGFRVLGMTQAVARANSAALQTTRCPIRIDGGLLTSPRGAPKVGQETATIRREFGLERRGRS